MASFSNVEETAELAFDAINYISGGAGEMVGNRERALEVSKEGGGVTDVGASVATGTGEGSGLGVMVVGAAD